MNNQQKLKPELLQRAITSCLRDKVIVESCEFFPKAELIDGKWKQTQAYLVKFKYDNTHNPNISIGDVSSDLKKAISEVEKLLSVEIVYENSVIPMVSLSLDDII